MIRFVDCFYYDYLLYKNIQAFIYDRKKKMDFDTLRALAHRYAVEDEELDVKLCLNKIISIFLRKKCILKLNEELAVRNDKNNHIIEFFESKCTCTNKKYCFKSIFESKLNKMIILIVRTDSKKLERLLDLLIVTLIILTNNKDAWENGRHSREKEKFLKKLRRVFWSKKFSEKRQIYLNRNKTDEVHHQRPFPESMSTEKQTNKSGTTPEKNNKHSSQQSEYQPESNTEKKTSHTFRRKYVGTTIKPDSRLYFRLVSVLIHREIKKVYKLLNKPLLEIFTNDKIKEIKKNAYRKEGDGKIVTWDGDSSINE
ncbi:hypothetical protein M153_2230001013 [Pseudoloma neurophilia]|uniref:Uncharacterized protein n=1 Tax=Pseudoloma neurophilia TaxID=146866 RepID=A0A0R0M304_9MICR|nr:hypothetical protein M153_2230001013 [Pseudoloma neurophilia]